jgi:hypothetical protein
MQVQLHWFFLSSRHAGVALTQPVPAVFNRDGSADYVSLKQPADRSFTQQIYHCTTYFLAVSPEHV